MNQYKKFLILASLSTIITHSATQSQYAAIEPDGPDADARPMKVAPPTPISVAADVANRKPAVEPRVYVENADSKTGFSYYDIPGQVRHSDPVTPKKVSDTF
jgi:hypothetical protein